MAGVSQEIINLEENVDSDPPPEPGGSNDDFDELIVVDEQHSIPVKKGSDKPGTLSGPLKHLDMNESVYFLFHYMEKTDEKTLVRYVSLVHL